MTRHTQGAGRDGELERRLEAYAVARLGPSLDASARMRSRVMREAHGGAAASVPAAVLAAESGAVTPRGSGSRLPSPFRRLIPALLAATLGLVVLVGGALAARPGGPLYDLRLFAEQAALPAAGAGREQAELGRLQERLDEAREAAAAGDRVGLVAALAAYAALLDQTIADVPTDPDHASQLEAALQEHLAVLAALGEAVPDPARDALARAVDQGRRALDAVLAGDGQGPNPGNGQGNGNGGAGPDQGGGNGQDNGNGQGNGNGQDNGLGPGNGNGPGNDNAGGQGNGKGQEKGSDATPAPTRSPDGTPGLPGDPSGRPGG